MAVGLCNIGSKASFLWLTFAHSADGRELMIDIKKWLCMPVLALVRIEKKCIVNYLVDRRYSESALHCKSCMVCMFFDYPN